MNHLAHFHLAAPEPEWMVGALLGDFVKGPLRGEWPAGWEQGIRLHRRIDALSDTHPQRRSLARALDPSLQRYAAILLDVYGDYWLTCHWSEFSSEPLAAFAADVYALLRQESPQLPGPAQQFCQRLIRYDLLGIYGEWSAVEGTLKRISQRLRHPNPLADSAPQLWRLRPALDQCCEAHYRDLLAAVAEFRTTQPLSAAARSC